MLQGETYNEMDQRKLSVNSFAQFLKTRSILLGAICLMFLLAISYSIRDKDFASVTGASNLEASYHVLLTMKALKASPVQSHWFLPTVSLGSKLDKNISWGATVPTKDGDYIYTSFTSPGFLVPYLVFEALQLEATERNLGRFNFVLGSLVTLVLYGLLFKMLRRSGFGNQVAASGAVLGAVVSIFSKEVLQSHGVVYWSHSLYQLILASSLYFLFMYLDKGSKQNNGRGRAAIYLLVSVFLGAWTEWTGYVFGIGLALLLWFGAFGEPPHKKLSIKLVLALTAAGVVTLLHYGLAVGFESAVQAFLARFFARSTSSGSLVVLLSGYAVSYGLFIVVVFALAVVSFFSKESANALVDRKVFFLFVAASIPLVENLVMMQHAGQFSFDRLKLLFPMAMIVSLAFARHRVLLKFVLVASLFLASVHGHRAYRADLLWHSSWAETDLKNKNLAKSLAKIVDIECSIFLSNINVRGYANLLFNRGIYEALGREESSAFLGRAQACAAIYLDGSGAFPDLPYYRSASVTKPDGSVSALEFLQVESTQKSFFMTDSNWKDGIAKHWAGFFVPNSDQLRSQLEKGGSVIFMNGAVRKITAVVPSGQYLNVYVEGDILRPADVGLPSSYLVLRSSSPRT